MPYQFTDDFADVDKLNTSQINAVEYTEANASDYNGVSLSPNNLTTIIDISAQSLTTPDFTLTPMSDVPVYVSAVTSSLITIGIGQGTATRVKFRLQVFEKYHS